jgi:hypothetical protein
MFCVAPKSFAVAISAIPPERTQYIAGRTARKSGLASTDQVQKLDQRFV